MGLPKVILVAFAIIMGLQGYFILAKQNTSDDLWLGLFCIGIAIAIPAIGILIAIIKKSKETS